MTEKALRNPTSPGFQAPKSAWSGRLALLAGQIGLLAAIMGIWEWAAVAEIVPRAFIGQPSVFIPAFFSGLLNGTYFSATLITMQAVLTAFCIGSFLALFTALVMTAAPPVERLLSPFIDALNALPRVALIPLFIIWFGLGITQKVVSGVSIMYFVLLSATLAGAKSVDPDHLLLARSLGIPRWQVFLQIVVPSAIPSIFAGMKLGMIYTVLGVITAELIAGGRGLGTLVSYYSNTFDTNGVFAVLILLIILTSCLAGLMNAVEKRIGRWRLA
ncbi:MAG: ABC transporter permease [Alphaproteobacteria bacterium]|nr:MAG: ABC transporter permease [Alphaproteobacteria bacterium]